MDKSTVVRLYLKSVLCFWVAGIFPAEVQAERVENPDLVYGEFAEGWPGWLSETNFFSDVGTLTPSAGVVAYEPNVDFWSDYAIKTRWVYVPTDEDIVFSEDGNWLFPQGTVWIKHFDMARVRGKPDLGVYPLETRFLVKNRFGSYGVSYRWNEEGTDAYLIGDDSNTFEIDVEIEGQAKVLDWTIPSRSDCSSCHVSGSGYALSFNTRQLNREVDIDGVLKNMIRHLSDEGYFSEPVESVSLFPYYSKADDETVSLDHRARSYLAVNCAYCHEPGGPIESNTWNGRPEILLAEMGLINKTPAEVGVGDSVKLVKPGDASNSLVWTRLGATGIDRMPPLATTEHDHSGMELIQRWIDVTLAGYLSYEDWIVAKLADASVEEQAKGSDPDEDGESNFMEYGNRTDPNDSNSRSNVVLAARGNSVEISFSASDFSNYWLETSSNLIDWSVFDVEGRNIMTLPSGEDRITIENDDLKPESGKSFIRVRSEQR